jgi:hypothetical protein
VNFNFNILKKNAQICFNQAVDDWLQHGIKNNDDIDPFSNYLLTDDFLGQLIPNYYDLEHLYLKTAEEKISNIIWSLSEKFDKIVGDTQQATIYYKHFNSFYKQILSFIRMIVLPISDLSDEEILTIAKEVF